MKRLVSIALAAIAVMTVAAFAPTQSVSAASSAALSITPKKNYRVEPGKSVEDTLVVRNLDANEALDLTLRVVDFTYTDDGGTPKLMLDPQAPQTTWSLKPFLNVPERVTIEPRSTQTLDMSVAIPANHGAGSYYSAIVYSSSAADGGNVGLSASGVTLVFTEIPGEVEQNLILEKLGAYHRDSSKYVRFTMQQPDAIAYTLENKGNVTESPVGSITLRHLFGHEIKIDNINPTGSLALIGQTRTFTSCIKLQSQEVDFNGDRTTANSCVDNPGLWPGYYKIELDAFYGRNDAGNQTRDIIGAASFWYLPGWFIIISLIVLALIAYFTWRIVVFVRTRLNGGNQFKKVRKRRR